MGTWLKEKALWALWKCALYFKYSVWGSHKNEAQQFSQTPVKRLRIV